MESKVSYSLLKRKNKRKKSEKKVYGKVKAAERDAVHAKELSFEEKFWAPRDAAIAKHLGTELTTQYPGHGWQIVANGKQGIATIYNRHVSGQFGWILKLKDISSDPGAFRKDMMRIGGELLRRFDIKADTMDENEILQLQRDFAGRTKVDLS